MLWVPCCLCFRRSRFCCWQPSALAKAPKSTGTRLYKDNLESYAQGKGMTRKTKMRIMVTVTILMSIGFIMMHRTNVGRIVLGCVWVFHLFYFLFGVKTIPGEIYPAPQRD